MNFSCVHYTPHSLLVWFCQKTDPLFCQKTTTEHIPEERVLSSFLESCFRPQPSHSHTKMETTTTTQLAKLNAEIDAITLLIASEKTELKSAAEADKADLRTSIERLNSRLEALIAQRHELAVLVAAPAPGKKPPLALYVSPHPPVCERHFILCLFSMPPPPPCLCFVVFFKF